MSPGNGRAVVIGPGLNPTDELETALYMNKIWERPKGERVTSISQFARFAYVRCNAYHAMIVTLMYGAVAAVKVTNVKQDAFFDSFSDKLSVEYNSPDSALVRCRDPRWFYNEVKDSMAKLLEYIG